MDAIDIKLINLLQKGIPLEKNPYAIIASQLGIGRLEVTERIKNLFEEGYIRRIGATFNNAGMGYTSVLFGLKVPDDVFDNVAEYVNSFKAVTHNYQRSGVLNMWFTFSAKDSDEKTHFLQGLQDSFKVMEIFEFPNLKNYKLNVFFELGGTEHNG